MNRDRVAVATSIILLLFAGALYIMLPEKHVEFLIQTDNVDNTRLSTEETRVNENVEGMSGQSRPVDGVDSFSVHTMELSASDSLPPSLVGAAMKTYTDTSGYSITYPASWVVGGHMELFEGQVSKFAVSPVTPPANLNPLIFIEVTEDSESMPTPDAALGESWVRINGVQGLLATGSHGVSIYIFMHDGMRYTIMTNDTFLVKENLSKAELMWVLSTFTLTS